MLAPLAAVYGQLQQNNKIARADLTHNVWQTAGAMNLSLYDTEEKPSLMHRAMYGTRPLGDVDKLRLIFFSLALGVGKVAFNLRQRGLMEDLRRPALSPAAGRHAEIPEMDARLGTAHL